VVGETDGRLENFLAAIESARKELKDYAGGGDPAGFIRKYKENDGATPLIAAASAGYSDIVAELLKNERVVASVNNADQHGITMGIRQLRAERSDLGLQSLSGTSPSFVTLPYYWSGTEHPYARTRRVLEAAGREKRYGSDTTALAQDLQTRDA
jgi:hypothetical protein